MAEPSSAHTIPSQRQRNAPSTQPTIACGPPMAERANGIVRNGPTPTMFSTFADIAPNGPRPRSSCCRFGVSVSIMRYKLGNHYENLGNRHRTPALLLCLFRLQLRVPCNTQEIGKYPVCSRHTQGKLSIESIGCVDVNPRPVTCHYHSTFLWLLAWIVSFQ